MPLQQDADSLGFTLRTDSLSQDIESYFNDTNPAQYDLFDVKYVLDPPGRQPVGAGDADRRTTAVTRSGEVADVSGYLEVVDTTEPVYANRTNMAAVFTQPVGGYLASPAVAQLRHPLVAFDGHTSADAVDERFGAVHRASGPGRHEQRLDLDNGRFAGQVTATRPSWVMLKESYAPHWRATVDGKPVKTAMLAPSFVGVPVPQGTHDVVFQYHSDTKYPEYVAVGLLTLLGTRVRTLDLASLPAARHHARREQGRAGRHRGRGFVSCADRGRRLGTLARSCSVSARGL